MLFIIPVILSIISAFLLAFNLYHQRGTINLILSTIISSVSTYVITSELVLQLNVFINSSDNPYWKYVLSISAGLIPIILLIPVRRTTTQPYKAMLLISLINIFIHLQIQDLTFVGLSALINIMFVLLITSITEDRQTQRIKSINDNLLKAQAKYYEDVNEANTKIRRIKHDMKNHLIAIEELNKLGDKAKTEEYIKSLKEQINKSDSIYRTGNDIADAILNEKIISARKQGIVINVEGDLNGLQIDPVDTCTILSNLLDNAIEASRKLYGMDMEKIILLEFKKNSNFIFITQTNKTINTQTDKTTKTEPNHGFGIQNIKDAVTRNDGEFNIEIKIDSKINEFKAEIMLPLK